MERALTSPKKDLSIIASKRIALKYNDAVFLLYFYWRTQIRFKKRKIILDVKFKFLNVSNKSLNFAKPMQVIQSGGCYDTKKKI